MQADSLRRDGRRLRSDDGDPVAFLSSGTGPTADRVVACYNALEGVENPEAVAELIQAARMIYTPGGVEAPQLVEALHGAMNKAGLAPKGGDDEDA